MAEQLKPFTTYYCERECGYSIYTGDGHMGARDSKCYCGGTLVAEKKCNTRYRLEFESINPLDAADIVARRGKDVWPALTDEEWNALSWHPVNREDNSERSVRQQYERLLQWAATHEQPIRNVRMFVSGVEWKAV
jgi:hypothetical protein